MYSILNRSGSFGDDFNHDIKLGEWLIPVYASLGDYDPSLMYLPCKIIHIDNTGRYQVIIVKDEDDYAMMLYYNGAQQVFKIVSDPDFEFLSEDAESKTPDKTIKKFISAGGYVDEDSSEKKI